MIFANSLLALGAMALAIPLTIHLLFRSRFTTVDWGAMHLLDSVVRINRKRLQWMHLLLLLLRCLIPVLLALCLAQPIFTAWRALPGDAPQSVVIAIDQSLSMSARDDSGTARFDQARSGLIDLLEQLSRRDEVLIVSSGHVANPADSLSPMQAIQRLRKSQPFSGAVHIPGLIDAAVNASENAEHSNRRIVIVSDFQSQDLANSTLDGLRRASERLKKSMPAPVVSLWNLGGASETLKNVSVDSVVIDSPAVIAGRIGKFSARVRNASDTPASNLRLSWSLDGNVVEGQSLTLDARSSSTVRLSRSIDNPGMHELSVAIELADALPEDNRRSIGVDVTREIRVLLVDGRPSREALQSESDFLALALSPFAFGNQNQPDAVRTVITTASQFDTVFQPKDFEVVVLANVRALEHRSQQLVAEHVATGGSLIFFDGDSVAPDEYNPGWHRRTLTTDGEGVTTQDIGVELKTHEQELHLPARLGSIVGQARKVGVADSGGVPMQIGELSPQYKPWNILGTTGDTPFGDVDVFAYRKLSIDDETATDELTTGVPATVLLAMANGAPLVVERRFGRGRVVQFATACDADWSTLPLRPSFLPMMQQLVLDLAGSQVNPTVNVGDAFVVTEAEILSGAGSSDATDDSNEKQSNTQRTHDLRAVTIRSPGGETVQIESDGQGRFIFAGCSSPGTYLISPVNDSQRSSVSVRSQTLRVAQVPPTESRLVDAEPARLAAAADLLMGTVYATADQLAADDRVNRYGREIWRWLLAALLFVMVLEVFVQQASISRRGRSKNDGLSPRDPKTITRGNGVRS